MRSTGDAEGTALHALEGTGGPGTGGGAAVTVLSRSLRRHVLDRRGEGVVPRPVPLEVPVHVLHLVVHPPIEVDTARRDAGDDPTGIVLLPLLAGGVGRGDVLTQPGEDRAELRLDRALRRVV